MLLTFLANSPIFTIYENLAKLNKWTKYMQKVPDFIAPFQHSNNPKDEYEKILAETGYKSIFCRVEDREFTYSNLKMLQSKNFLMYVTLHKFLFRICFSGQSIYFTTDSRGNRKLLAGFYE